MNNIDFNKYFNLSELSEEQQQLVIGSITDLVLARMATMIGEHLTEEEITELEQLSEQGDGEKVMTWLNQHVPNFSEGIDEILKEESANIAAQVTALTSLAVEEK